MRELSSSAFPLGETSLHLLHTPDGDMFVTADLAVKLFDSAPATFAEFVRAVASYAPGAERHALRALYDHHARADVDAPAGPRSFSVDASSFARALFAKEIAPPAAEPPAPAPAAAPWRHPWDDAGTGGRRPTQQRRSAAAAAVDGAAAAVPLARVAERAAARPPLECDAAQI